MRKLAVVLSGLLMMFATGLCQTSKTSPDTVKAGTRFEVRLTKSLDVKKVKVGDLFTLESVYPIQIGTTTIESGAKFQARILRVQKKAKNVRSELAFVVEKLTWKGGELSLNAYPIGFRGRPMAQVKSKPVLVNAAFTGQQPIVTPPPPERPREPGSEMNRSVRAPYSLGPEPSPLGGIAGANASYNGMLPEVIRVSTPQAGTVMWTIWNIYLESGTIITIEQMN